MAKVSKNARTDRGLNKEAKNFVKVIKAVKSAKTGAYTYREKMIHKDNVKEFSNLKTNFQAYKVYKLLCVRTAEAFFV